MSIYRASNDNKPSYLTAESYSLNASGEPSNPASSASLRIESHSQRQRSAVETWLTHDKSKPSADVNGARRSPPIARLEKACQARTSNICNVLSNVPLIEIDLI